jgi:beta-glucosidase
VFSAGSCRPAHFVLDDNEIAPAEPAGRRPPTFEATLETGRGYALRVDCPMTRNSRHPVLSWIPPAEPLLAEAVEAAKGADAVVAFVGLNPNLEGEEMPVSIPGFAGGDRTDLNLPASQQKLLEAVAATGKPLVVVLASGSAVAINYAAEHARAVLQLWYGGEEAGTALAETLAGANNPAGRLPVTFYRDAGQLPPFEEYSMANRTYRYFQGDPLYGFGYGLSYSKFAYSGLVVRRNPDGTARVSAQVTNQSKRAGDEVAQVYVSEPGGGEPVRSLAGFERLHLRAGETRTVAFRVEFTVQSDAGAWVSIGGGQPLAGIPHVNGRL